MEEYDESMRVNDSITDVRLLSMSREPRNKPSPNYLT